MVVHPVLSRYELGIMRDVADAVCYKLDIGTSWAAVALDAFITSPEDWDEDTVSFFFASAINAFCPEHRQVIGS